MKYFKQKVVVKNDKSFKDKKRRPRKNQMKTNDLN